YRRREPVSYECSNPLRSGVGSPSKSWSISSRTNWTRLCTPSLRYALNTWDSTVRGLMCNAAPISRAVAPEAMCLMTSSSRAVNLVWTRAPASCSTATVSMLTTPPLRTRLRLLPSSDAPPLFVVWSERRPRVTEGCWVAEGSEPTLIRQPTTRDAVADRGGRPATAAPTLTRWAVIPRRLLDDHDGCRACWLP